MQMKWKIPCAHEKILMEMKGVLQTLMYLTYITLWIFAFSTIMYKYTELLKDEV